jgi:hypothetical protein
MARVLALAADFRAVPLEALRIGIVCGCAITLIVAHQPLPF